jgi:heme/copper-type cytochrome/quinol oxidase subunit 4
MTEDGETPMAIGSPVPHRGAYLLLEIIIAIVIGVPVIAGILWIVGETIEHFTP